MRSTFCVLFYLKRKDVRKDGTVPVMGRITIDGGKPAQFSCKMTVDPALWNTETGRMTGRSVAAQEMNKMLDGIRVKINSHYREIVDRDGFVTAEKVKNAFLGLEYRHETTTSSTAISTSWYKPECGQNPRNKSILPFTTT